MIKTKTKKRIRITAIAVVLVLVVLFGYLMVRITNQAKWTNTSLTYELGQKVNIQATDVLDRDDKSFMIDTSSVDEDKPGAYVAHASINTISGKQIRNIKVLIEDTKAPTFTKLPKVIRVNYGDSDYNFKKKIKAKDLSKLNITVDTKKVDFYTPGTYKVTVKAQDIYGNITKKKIKVIVRDYNDYVFDEEDEEKEEPSKDSQNQDSSTTDQNAYDSTDDSNSGNDAASNGSQITPGNYDTSQYDPSKGFGQDYSA